ncbi:MAG: alanine racemase, partial [Alphaproteobacteria bacterium]|nr:alanine racemase [Alphaproteobacteria bacterium]
MASPDPTAPTHATTFLTIDLDAVAANYRLLAREAAPAQCGAVIKADGYGLGVMPVARTLRSAGCSEFFVAHLDEGILLRETMAADGSECRIHVFNGLMQGKEEEFAAHDLMPVLNDLGQIERWAAFCRREDGRPATVHFDTGMSRLGLPPAEADILLDEPARLDGFPLRCIISHLACAETPKHPLNKEQQRRFAAIAGRLPDAVASLAASSGIFLGPDWHFDLVRPGVSLFGVAPTKGKPNPLTQVVSLHGKIIQIRDVDAPQTVGYGATHQFTGPARLATVAAGYADGYLRSLSGRGSAYIG